MTLRIKSFKCSCFICLALCFLPPALHREPVSFPLRSPDLGKCGMWQMLKNNWFVGETERPLGLASGDRNWSLNVLTTCLTGIGSLMSPLWVWVSSSLKWCNLEWMNSADDVSFKIPWHFSAGQDLRVTLCWVFSRQVGHDCYLGAEPLDSRQGHRVIDLEKALKILWLSPFPSLNEGVASTKLSWWVFCLNISREWEITTWDSSIGGQKAHLGVKPEMVILKP